jgi:dihydrofolate reductase
MSRKITVVNHLTLDGVMQAPARPDEDTRGGFEQGGWAISRNDPVMPEEIGKGMGGGASFLLGRRTYEDFFDVWPKRTESPFSKALTEATKYVVSRTLAEPLPWENSVLLSGDGADAVEALKRDPGPDLAVFGSGELVRSLTRRRLIDRYVLLIHPLVLGSGMRMFADDGPATTLKLLRSVTSTTGVIVATYETADL